MQKDIIRFKESVFYPIGFVVFLWAIKIYESLFSVDFTEYGILPEKVSGLKGIITGPLVHGDFNHLFSNTIPLLISAIGIIYFYRKIAVKAILIIYIATGLGVWIAARDAYHIGISGVVYGLVAFLFFSGVFRKDTRSIAVSLIVIFLLGGMIYGIFPTDSKISWESHLIGALSGVFTSFYFRKVDVFEPIYAPGFSDESIITSVTELPEDIVKTSEPISFIYDFKPSGKRNGEKPS